MINLINNIPGTQPAPTPRAPRPGAMEGGFARAAGGQAVRDRVSLSEPARKARGAGGNPDDLTPEEQQAVNELKKRDAEVKAHEQAHMAAGAGIVQGGASYQYQVGPDGKRYAVGGEVKIDVSPERTPEATIRKMQQVKAAALAPAQPSGADRAVAARAGQIEARARSEKTQQEKEPPDKDETHDAAPGGETPHPQVFGPARATGFAIDLNV